MTQKTETLAEAYDRELNRNRDLLAEYRCMPPASGWFGVSVLTLLIACAEKASREGDVVQMLVIYSDLQDSQ